MSMLDNIFGVHENAMQLRQRRLSLLGENIANADTPNYKAKDLDFKALINNERSCLAKISRTQTPLTTKQRTWILRR